MKKLLAVLLLLTLALTACTTTPAAPSGTPASEPAVSEPAASEPAASAPADDTQGESALKMAWYFPVPFPYGDSVQVGVKKYEEETGITVMQEIGPDTEQSSQNERVEALVAQGVNAISIFPSDASAANALYEEITAQGVKVINFGASTVTPTTASFAVATDVSTAAYDACKFLIEQMGEEGNILNVLETITDPNTILRREAIEKCVAEYPNVTIVQEIADISTTEDAIVKIESGFSANAGNIDGVICTGYATTVGLANVLDNYYAQGGERIHAIGMDEDPITMDAIRNGVLDATMAQNPVGHGYISLELLRLMVEEGYSEAEGKYFVDAGCVIVTVDNIDSYAADLEQVTQDILGQLTTEYLTK